MRKSMYKGIIFSRLLTGLPLGLTNAELTNSVRTADYMAEMQPSRDPRLRMGAHASVRDPAHYGPSRISPADLRVIRDKFPQLSEFSEEFLQSRTLEELLRIESTVVRSRDSERARESEDKLAVNKANLATKFYDVPAGRDNRWSELHPARFLPGVACSAQKEYTTAREVIGLTSPPAVGCYDLTSVGMGGFVTSKGWLELQNNGSTKMKVGMFNLNNAAKSMSGRSAEIDDFSEMKDISEYELALRTMRVAAHFAVPWNKAFVALENYMIGRKYCAEELKNDPNPGRTLCHFTDFVINENANHWRDGTGFLTTGDLEGYWRSFIGARPQSKAPTVQQPVGLQNTGIKQSKDGNKKKKHPFVDICPKWNVGKCAKPAGSCYTNGGVALRHVCNWRDFTIQNAQPCAQAHTRRGNH
jgi:hypothetical protein